MTARTAAFDGNWVGGQEAYQPCCAEHHAVMDVFVAPEALVSNWGELAGYAHRIYKLLCIDERQFCEMLNALVVALAADRNVVAAACPRCFKIHLDKERWAATQHRTHLCETCGALFKLPVAGVGNLLSV